MKTRAPYPPVDGSEPCRTGDPERFFPHGGPQIDAEALCRGCHVLEQCRDFAIDAVTTTGYQVNGVWGGTAASTRRRIRSARHHASEDAA
jgi:WhiB family redox-sensing transcriptional regulator